MGLLLKSGWVVDPVEGIVEKQDILIERDRIAEIAKTIGEAGHRIVDVAGLYVLPGLIDVHVHLREPGQEHKETIATGTRAAAAGGFTQVCAMPNTAPVTDRPEVAGLIKSEAERHGFAAVHPVAAITVGSRGLELTDFEALRAAGAVAFSDDGRGVQSAAMMKKALRWAKELGVPIAVHAEDESLSDAGHLNDGPVARDLGVKGSAGDAETAMIARDIVLAEATGGHAHFCHVSAAHAVAVIRDGKRRGVPISAEVAPHHLLLTEEAVRLQGSMAKVNPPLRSETDRRACVEGFLDGTLDVIATDHAPHTLEEKERAIESAPFGLVGLEISFPLLYTAFVHSGILTLPQLVARMSTRPAELFRLSGGRLEVGGLADIAVVDARTPRIVAPERFYSKGRNTPFAGRSLFGWPVWTMRAGSIAHDLL